MQSDIVDKKIKIIYDNYRETPYAKFAQLEVEQIRNSAAKYGMGITVSAFVANEFARMTMRSRK